MGSAFWFVTLIVAGLVVVTMFIFSRRRKSRLSDSNKTLPPSWPPAATAPNRGPQRIERVPSVRISGDSEPGMVFLDYAIGRSQEKSKDVLTPPPAVDRIDEDVQFTVYRPSIIAPQLWYTLVAFAHLSKRPPDAPISEPDPAKEVQRLAAKILSDQPARYEAAKLDRGFSVPRKGLLTFVPLIEGCEFNPPTQSILWQRTVHKVEFEMMALRKVDGREVEGQMTVYLGNIILTEVPLRISVDSNYVAPQSQALETEEASATPYRKIFASYSHQDTEIVEDFENYVRALGDTYLRDVQTLRAGEVWSERLEEMIREASVFQLFWSSKSMPSKFVRQEWEYALSLNRPKFIRPVYWEEPLPETKPDLPPPSLRRLHFYKFPGHGAEERERMTALPPAQLSLASPERGLEEDNVPSPKPAPTTFIPKALMSVAVAFVSLAAVAYLGIFGLLRSRESANANVHKALPSPSAYGTPDVRIHVLPLNTVRDKGDSGSYEIVIENEGPGRITNLEVSEFLPAELDYVSSNPEAFLKDGNRIFWRLHESLEPGRATFRIRVTVRLRSKLTSGNSIKTFQSVAYTDESGNRWTLSGSTKP